MTEYKEVLEQDDELPPELPVLPQNGVSVQDAEIIASLNAEIERLNGIILEKQLIEAENAEFNSCFPNVAREQIPDEVYSSVGGRCSLAAAYALFVKKNELVSQNAQAAKAQNELRAAGKISGSTERFGYTLEEISVMTPSEIKKNYNSIIKFLSKRGK